MSRKIDGATGAPELTPAQADAELLQRAGELNDDEVERLAVIADEGDEEAAGREMPDSAGWTQRERDEIVAGWRAGRRWLAESAMRPGESGDEWRERLIAQSVAEYGCAPMVIPASRAENVIEVDLAKVPRRKRQRLFKPGGHRSLKAARRHTLRVLGHTGVVALPVRAGARPRERREARRAARRGSTRAGPGSDDPHLELSPVLPEGRA